METANMRPRTTATLLAVGAIFGSSFLLVKFLVTEISPGQITAWRLLFGGLAVMAMLASRGDLRLPQRSLVAKAAVLGLLDSVIPNTLLAWSQIRIDSSIAAVLISSMPLFTVLFAMALPRSERLSAAKAGGLVMGIAGVAILVGANSNGAATGPPTAHLAVILAAMSNAAAVVYARRLLAEQDPLQLSGLKLVVGAMIALAIVGGVDRGGEVPEYGRRVRGAHWSRWACCRTGSDGRCISRSSRRRAASAHRWSPTSCLSWVSCWDGWCWVSGSALVRHRESS